LEWYLDDEFIMGIDAAVLELTGAQIPEVRQRADRNLRDSVFLGTFISNSEHGGVSFVGLP
jgi:hypothetical protein